MNPGDVYYLERPYFEWSYPQFPTILKGPVSIRQRQKQDNRNKNPLGINKKLTIS